MLILISGPYRSGTNDDPAKMAANQLELEMQPGRGLFLTATRGVPICDVVLRLPGESRRARR